MAMVRCVVLTSRDGRITVKECGGVVVDKGTKLVCSEEKAKEVLRGNPGLVESQTIIVDCMQTGWEVWNSSPPVKDRSMAGSGKAHEKKGI